MKIDYQLIVEAETILPKLEGFLDNCHTVQSHLNWYRKACDGTDTPNPTAEEFRRYLVKSVAEAKRLLAEHAMSVMERSRLIQEAAKYSPEECHAIDKWLCGIRDFDEYPRIVELMETMLRAFIARKKQGTPVTIREVEEEFGLTDAGLGLLLQKYINHRNNL